MMKIDVGSRWVHLKTGRTYRVVGRCQLEATGAPAILYTLDASDGGVVWARDVAEFADGRFAPPAVRPDPFEVVSIPVARFNAEGMVAALDAMLLRVSDAPAPLDEEAFNRINSLRSLLALAAKGAR